MRYYKMIDDEYIIAVGTGKYGEEITKSEYDAIRTVAKNCPVPPEGYGYQLKTNLTWELFELPEITDNEECVDSETALSEILEVLNDET